MHPHPNSTLVIPKPRLCLMQSLVGVTGHNYASKNNYFNMKGAFQKHRGHVRELPQANIKNCNMFFSNS